LEINDYLHISDRSFSES